MGDLVLEESDKAVESVSDGSVDVEAVDIAETVVDPEAVDVEAIHVDVGAIQAQLDKANERIKQAEEEAAESDSNDEPKTYDEAYVKSLRDESASRRKKLQEKDSEIGTLSAENERLSAELNKLKKQEEVAALISEVAEEFKVDAVLLRGETRDELAAHAEVLKDHLSVKKAGVSRYAGTGPEKTPSRSIEDIQREAYEKHKGN